MNYTVQKPTKIGCYVQPRSNIKTLAAVKQSVGADVIVNFQLYNFSDFASVFALRVNGKDLTNDPAPYWGYGWNNNDTKLTLAVSTDMRRFDNFAGSVLVLMDSKPISNPAYGQVCPGVRGRTCIGRKANGDIVIYCWPDGSAGACMIGKLGEKMLALGCIDAVSFDGGGSCQMSCPDGNVYPQRYVASFLWFQLSKAEPAPAPSPTIPQDKTELLEEGYRRLYYGKLGTDRGTWAKQHGLTPSEFQTYINKRWPAVPARI